MVRPDLSTVTSHIMRKGFAWNRKCLLLGVKEPGCVVSGFSDTSSVHVGLFLAFVDNF